MSPTNTLFSVLSFLTCICVSIPFPWHLEAWNTGTCLLMAWIGLSSMNNFVNSVIWRADAINRAPVWCDISSKFFMGAVVGIPASVLCISRRLYRIASIQVAITTRADKRRAVVFDLVMGVGVPIIYMALHYIVQGHRFNIFQEVGCFPFTYNTPLAYVLVMFPPLLLGVASGIYAILALIALKQRHHEFKSMVSQSSSQLTSGRYFRLMAIAGLDILCTVPLNVYTIYANLRGNVAPWISWEDTHSGFSRVDQFPSVIWRSDPALELSVEFNRWMLVAMGIIFFLFFGITGEAVKHYKAA
ncbi:STE3-like pheromone receptor, partial [Infundibulicybe gibba]